MLECERGRPSRVPCVAGAIAKISVFRFFLGAGCCFICFAFPLGWAVWTGVMHEQVQTKVARRRPVWDTSEPGGIVCVDASSSNKRMKRVKRRFALAEQCRGWAFTFLWGLEDMKNGKKSRFFGGALVPPSLLIFVFITCSLIFTIQSSSFRSPPAPLLPLILKKFHTGFPGPPSRP